MSDDSKGPPVFKPDLQVSFFFRLKEIRERYLQDALRQAVANSNIAQLDDELRQIVDPGALQRVASAGLRGELVFPLPTLLTTSPFLLGYYRLLYGLSQKEAYRCIGRFKKMEEEGVVPANAADDVPWLCKYLCKTGELLVQGIDELSVDVLHDLQLLTAGPQFRGSENTRIGESAAVEVFDLIGAIAGSAVEEATRRTLVIKNSAGRTVLVTVASDPDVAITEEVNGRMQPRLAMEIKGGSDVSNVHNRIGEAEKSHQKARNKGFIEFWTIIRANVNEADARKESPTTTRFFDLGRILDRQSDGFGQFRSELAARLGIAC